MTHPARRPRLEDVATDAGVSTATVSLVLRAAPGPSASTRERVLAAANRLGYRPDRAASALASRRSGLVGVLLDITSSFHGQLVTGLDGVTDQHGYDLLLSTVTRSRSEQRAIETLLDSRCEALDLVAVVATFGGLLFGYDTGVRPLEVVDEPHEHLTGAERHHSTKLTLTSAVHEPETPAVVASKVAVSDGVVALTLRTPSGEPFAG